MSPLYDFNLGYPDLEIVPKERLAALTAELMAAGRGLQYGGDLKGALFIRQQVAQFLRSQTGDDVDTDELMITTGSLHALDTACRALSNPGDVILVERPTFFFALGLFKMSRLEIVSVPLNEEGVDLDALREILHQYGSRVKLFYTIPSFQNPSGVCATAQNRQTLVELAVEHKFILLEDTAYHFLYFDTPTPPMLKHYDAGRGHVVTLGTFSKLITPSLRQGWAWITRAQNELFMRYKSDASASLFTGELISEFIRRGEIEPQLERVRAFYRRKLTALSDAMHEYLPSWIEWKEPGGGFFVWATLPADRSAAKIRAAALQRGVDFMPGHLSFPEPVIDRYMRFCFALLPEKTMVEGMAVLGQVLKEMEA